MGPLTTSQVNKAGRLLRKSATGGASGEELANARDVLLEAGPAAVDAKPV